MLTTNVMHLQKTEFVQWSYFVIVLNIVQEREWDMGKCCISTKKYKVLLDDIIMLKHLINNDLQTL